MEKSWIVAVAILGAFVSVESLQCYECTNCPSSLEDSLLVSCPVATTTTATPSTTTPGVSINTVTTPTNDTTAPPTNNTTPDIDISPGNDTASNPGAFRVRREALTDIGEGNKCTCFGAGCACDEKNDASRSIQYAEANDTTYVCAKATSKLQNGTEITSRGCAPSTINDKEFCTFEKELAAAVNITMTYCSTCNTDKCNGAFSVENSTIAMVLVLTMLFIAK